MKLIEYFFLWHCAVLPLPLILPGRALENGVPCAERGAFVTSH